MPPKKTKQSEKTQQKLTEFEPVKKKQIKSNPSTTPSKEQTENNKQDQKIQQTLQSSSKQATYNSNGDYTGILGDGKFSNQNSILISSWNVNGIRAVQKKDDFNNYLKKYNPDILCLNETKIDSETFKKDNSLINSIPQQYHQFWNFCKPPQKGYAGTAIFSKVAPISVKYDLGIKKHDQEGRTITLEYDKFYLIACYVPNAGQGLKRLDYRVKEWDQDFQKYLNDLKKNKHVILCGDLNVCHQEIDIAKPKGNEKSAGFTKEERAEFTKFLNQGWIDSFRKKYPTKVQYSYWNARSGARKINQGWRLDYFVVDQPFYEFINDSIINNDIEGSDHCPIELNIDNSKLKC